MKTSFHLFVSLSLVFIGEYSTVALFQIAFIATYLRVPILLYAFYVPAIYFILLKLFASGEYFLYFLNFVFFIHYLLQSQNLLNAKELLVFVPYLSLVALAYVGLEEIRYELYLNVDIVDDVNFIDDFVIYALTSLHTTVLFFMGYNREKLYTT